MFHGLALQPLNRLLQGEAWARDLLKPHANKGAALSLGGVGLRVQVTQAGLLEKLDPNLEPHVSIDLPASALSALPDGADQLTKLAQVRGDAGFAETISQLLKHLRPDVGAALAPMLGNVLAHRVERGLSQANSTAQDVVRRLSVNIVEYVRDEQGLVVQQDEVSTLRTDLAATTDALNRLDARVARLMR